VQGVRFLLPAALGAGLLVAPLQAELTASEERREDIVAFRERFLKVDRSYSDAARGEAEMRLTALEERAGEILPAYFELELSRIVALADNAHTVYFAGPRSRRFNRILEVRLAPFGEDFYVLRAVPEHTDLLGARLVTIDGRSISEVRETARSLAGGTPSWRDRGAAYFLESPEQMHSLGVLADKEQADYGFRLADGNIVTRRFTPEPANPDRVRANADRWLYPQLVEEEGQNWRALLAVDRAPWALQHPGEPFRMRDAPEMDAFVIELRQNHSSGGSDIAEFMLESLDAVRASGRRNIVLDLRINGGGDLNNTRAWVRRLPRAVSGQVYVLTSPWTFSAAISTVGYLKQEAPERVTIVGEQLGDRLDFYSEGSVVVLPHCGAAILNATERHDYRTGCRDIEDCHDSVVLHPISVDSLAPDIEAPWTIEAYRAGRDPAMEAVAAAVSPRATTSGTCAELNRRFVDPDLDVQTWVDRFEGESREVFAARHEVLKAAGVGAGDRVADIGAGTGLYTRLFAESVGETGRVYAVEISAVFLNHINEKVVQAGLANVTSVLGHVDATTLPPESVDVAFLCDTYHHLEAVEPMLASIRDALAPGGRLIVIEFERIEGTSRPWILDHVRAGKEVFRSEIEAAGFAFAEEIEIPGFAENYFLVFKKDR
jgi:SAM-dependent methyltransferase